MPTISRFFGIIISMHPSDHPPPHFHAQYAEDEALIGIEPLALLKGNLPPRVLGLVLEWAALHRDELGSNWELADAHRPLKQIRPIA